MLKAIVFDLDNTLVDFMAMKRLAIDAAVTAMLDAGLDLAPQAVLERIDAIYKEQGIEYQLVFDKLLDDALGRVDHKILSAGIIAYRRSREAALKPYPHVTATLVELGKRGLKLAVVSDAPSREAWLRLCYVNLHHLFDVVITFDDTRERKPSPAPFEAALKKLNVAADEALMIGDWAERDIIGAAKVGMKTAFARYGDTFNTERTGADYDVNDISELLKIVEKENGK